jgi:hypothetical protein
MQVNWKKNFFGLLHWFDDTGAILLRRFDRGYLFHGNHYPAVKLLETGQFSPGLFMEAVNFIT